MILFKDIEKSFGKLNVLSDVNVEFSGGHSIAVVGPNGSGKTTLIKMLLGMVLPDKGKVYFDGKSISESHQYRGRIGYMPQISNYPPNLKVSQLISMMTDIRESAGWTGKLDNELIDAFEIDSFSNKTMGTLSGGTRQKVGAALAFRFNPDVLILDEPTAGLDPAACEILKDKIQNERQKGKLLILTSHILSDLDELTDHILFMSNSRIQFYQEIKGLKEEFQEDKLGKIIAQLMRAKSKSQSKILVS